MKGWWWSGDKLQNNIYNISLIFPSISLHSWHTYADFLNLAASSFLTYFWSHLPHFSPFPTSLLHSTQIVSHFFLFATPSPVFFSGLPIVLVQALGLKLIDLIDLRASFENFVLTQCVYDDCADDFAQDLLSLTDPTIFPKNSLPTIPYSMSKRSKIAYKSSWSTRLILSSWYHGKIVKRIRGQISVRFDVLLPSWLVLKHRVYHEGLTGRASNHRITYITYLKMFMILIVCSSTGNFCFK